MPDRTVFELVRFRYNPRVEKAIAQDPRMAAHTLNLARQVAAQVPRQMPGHRRSAPFVRKLYAGNLADGSAVVGTTWSLGHIIEWGSINNPPYAPLRRAVRAAGLRFREMPRGTRRR